MPLQDAWDGEDFTPAFRARFLDGVLPIILGSVSLALIIAQYSLKYLLRCLQRRRRRRRMIDNGGGMMPSLVIEEEAEHEELHSKDLMLEAENEVIRESVKRQGVVWSGAFRALGLLKQREDHHVKPDTSRKKYLQVPDDGRDHASDSWIQVWRSKRRNATKKRRKRRSWRDMLKRLWRNGKKNFVQALVAWGVVAVLFVKAARSASPHKGWSFVPGIVWTYFALLMEVRQYSPILRRSPFEPKISALLTYHIGVFLVIYSLVTILELRSTVLHHTRRTQIAEQASITALSLLTLFLELFAPTKSPFMHKSALRGERDGMRSGRSSPLGTATTAGEAGEEDALLADDVFDGDDEEDAAVYKAILDLLPEDESEPVDQKLEKARLVPPPELGASIFAKATFTYIGAFIFKHSRTAATLPDVPDLRADDKSASVILEFRASCKTFPRWLRARSKSGMRKRPPIFLQMCWYFLPQLIPQAGWAFVKPFVVVLPPVFIQLLLKWATARGRGEVVKVHVALLYVAGLFSAQMASSLCMSQALIIGRRLCIRAKALIIAEVFTKTLRRKDLAGKALTSGESKPDDAATAADGHGPASAGRIQNLVSVDASRISELFAYIHFFFPEAPLTLAVALTMLFKLIGPSAFAAFGTMLLLLPFQTLVARFFMRYQNQVLIAADDRLSLSTEVFQAIKVLKFFAWERKFNEKLQEKRSKELVALRKRVMVFAAGGIALFGAPILIALVTFLFHTKVFHKPLDATTAFTALSLFNVLRAPLDQVADLLSQFLNTIISCSRVDALLEEEETAKYAIVTRPTTASDPKIGFVNAAFCWADAKSAMSDGSTDFKLQNLSLRFVIDGLNLIIGPVGSGKSSLLYALLGEMNLLGGRCFIPQPIVRKIGEDPSTLTDTVAFCSQTPWLLNDTIRNNILFGSVYNARRYKQVLHACALVPDLAVLDLKDRTEVGEKGTVLSGGQKARISLARAVYSSAKVLLMDDVLSAVDAHTARHLYHNCLTSTKLMRGRTRLLVTHALHLTLPLADYVVALSNGFVAFDGQSANYVAASEANTPGISGGQDFSSLHLKVLTDKTRALTQPIETEDAADAVADQGHEDNFHPWADDPLHGETLLHNQEKQSTGAVSLGVYTFYVKAAGSAAVLSALVAVIVTTEAVSVGSNWALRLWAQSFDYAIEARGNGTLVAFRQVALGQSPATRFDMHQPDYYLRYYVILACSALLLFGIRMLFFLSRGIVASRVIYTDVVQALLTAPVRFYDSTPIGRILNRLSKDMETIDQEVPAKGMFFVLELFGTCTVVLAITVAIPAFLLVGVIIAAAYTILGFLYISSSRELKRIEAVTRSPVYSLVGECLMGVTSIRAYSDASRFTSSLFDLVDATNRPFFTLWLTNRWLSVRSDFGGAVVAMVTAVFIILNPRVSASLAGFAMTYANLMEDRILWIVRLYAETQINMNSVERIREYTLELPQEPQGGKEPPAYWPSNHAGIRVEKLAVRYAEGLPLALKGVSFEVKPSERIAIVGRTGSGKSTLALSFFRFIEAVAGKIVIDGIDIATLPLHTLREKLTIIPQDAALFKGTVRFNLDPFGTFSDAELYDVLKRTNLLSSGSATPGGQSGINSLDDQIQEGAKNFSAGQRQLICLARGLLKLRQSNILILDESTANLDHDTDVAVQQTIREELGDSTILCIAHRLHTIIDFDRVLVLGQGEVLEYDTPAALLAKEGSEFHRLCKESGDLARLKELADAHAAEMSSA